MRSIVLISLWLTLSFNAFTQSPSLDLTASPPHLNLEPPPACILFRETMPYPLNTSCELVAKAVQHDCFNTLVTDFIRQNLRYPGPDICIEGTCVVSFTVFSDGSVGELQLRRDIGADTGEEALRVVQLFLNTYPTWQPGTQYNRPVDVWFYLPVRFRLE